MKTMYRAILNLKGKETTFRKSSDTIPNLIKLIKNEGIEWGHVVRVETFSVSLEKQRGKVARKY